MKKRKRRRKKLSRDNFSFFSNRSKKILSTNQKKKILIKCVSLVLILDTSSTNHYLKNVSLSLCKIKKHNLKGNSIFLFYFHACIILITSYTYIKKKYRLKDYSCAIQKDILVHGRLYVSQNYVCFHANIIVYETRFVLKWKDVTSISECE